MSATVSRHPASPALPTSFAFTSASFAGSLTPSQPGNRWVAAVLRLAVTRWPGADPRETEGSSTFYRYFPTKEDAVLDDDYDPIVEDVIVSRDRDEPLVTTIRAAVAALATAVEADRDEALERLKLRATVPALQARQGGEGRRTLEFFIGLFSARSGRPADDYRLRVTAAAFTAAQLEAARRWADTGGTESLGQLMDDAVTFIEPLIAAL